MDNSWDCIHIANWKACKCFKMTEIGKKGGKTWKATSGNNCMVLDENSNDVGRWHFLCSTDIFPISKYCGWPDVKPLMTVRLEKGIMIRACD